MHAGPDRNDKTPRRSYQTKGSKEAIHMVFAFATRQRIVLDRVSEKSNEIVAIPAMLDMMTIEGAVGAIHAMGANATSQTKIIYTVIHVSTGSRRATNGRASTPLWWPKASAKSTARSPARHASTSPH
jgi:hypothetical protein